MKRIINNQNQNISKIKNTTSPLAPLLKGEGKPPSPPRRRGLGDEV